MRFLLTEIWPALLGAVLVGFAWAWLAFVWRRQRISTVELGQLQHDAVASRERANALDAEKAELLAEARSLEAKITELDDRATQTQTKLDAHNRVLESAEAELRKRGAHAAELEAEHASLRERIELLNSDVRTARTENMELFRSLRNERKLRASPRLADDDLTRIQGVKRTMQRFLRRNGIRRFAQLAALDDDDVDALQAKLPKFPNRIHEQDWVGQAKRLL